jgi:response regulator RpfG family c-di-GMP phosphodiesterase
MMEGRGTHFDPELTDLSLYMWDKFVDIHQKCAEEDFGLVGY